MQAALSVIDQDVLERATQFMEWCGQVKSKWLLSDDPFFRTIQIMN